ncbi:MAG: alpha/beta fold hydrolase [Verrucomicrobiota bacterium]
MSTSHILNSAGERIDVTYHPSERHDTLVIIGHGVTGNKDRSLVVELAEGLAARGWSCLRMSFAGNGDSEGNFEDCTISREIGDLKAVLETVPDWVRVIYIGHSMGGAVGVLTAVEDVRIGGLVSLAGMTHTAAFYEREFGLRTPGQDVMWEKPECPLSQAFADGMKEVGNTLEAAGKIVQPWLLIHGEADDVVPIQDGIDAHAAAICQKRWVAVPGGDHSFDGVRHVVIAEVDAWLKAMAG